jgi:hypothetical protein
VIKAGMKKRTGLLAFLFIVACGPWSSAGAQKRHDVPPRLLTAKLVYFENQTGFPAVGGDAVRELQKWGRYQVVQSREEADLIFVLSSRIEADGVRSPFEDRRFGPDLSVHFRYRPANAYLTVDDAMTGERLWSGRHLWGGLLTGFNSAGRRLVHRLRKQVEQ